MCGNNSCGCDNSWWICILFIVLIWVCCCNGGNLCGLFGGGCGGGCGNDCDNGCGGCGGCGCR